MMSNCARFQTQKTAASDKLTEAQKQTKNIEKMAGKPVSRILCDARAFPSARRGDHSSRSRLAPGLQQPTRGS